MKRALKEPFQVKKTKLNDEEKLQVQKYMFFLKQSFDD